MLTTNCEHFANATLLYYEYTIVSPTSTYCEPERDANTTPLLVSSVRLSLEELYSNKEDKTTGTRSDSRKFTGRAVNPLMLPSEFVQDTQYLLEFDYSQSRPVSRHKCYLRRLPTSRLGLESYFGAYIELEVFFQND